MGWDWGMRRKDRDYRRDRGWGWGGSGLGLVVLCSTWKIYWRWAMLFKGMRPLREYHVSFDYVLSCWQCWSVVSSPPSPPLLVVYSVGNAGRKEKLAIERRLLISLPHIVLYNPTEPGPDTAIWQWERAYFIANYAADRRRRTRRARNALGGQRQDVAFNVDNLPPPRLRSTLKPDSVWSSMEQRLNHNKWEEFVYKTELCML